MDYAACNIVYVDRTAKEDRLVRRKASVSSSSGEVYTEGAEVLTPLPSNPTTCDLNVRTLLETFSEGEVPCALQV